LLWISGKGFVLAFAGQRGIGSAFICEISGEGFAVAVRDFHSVMAV